MKKSSVKKNNKKMKSPVSDIPSYKILVPCIMLAYMVISLIVVGTDAKELTLGVASICMILWFIGEKIFPDRVYKDSVHSHNKYIYIFAGMFIFMTILSEIFADDYSTSSLVGEYDSLLVIMCYIVLFYMSYRYFYMDKVQMLVKWGILAVTILTVLMSLLEFLDVSWAVWWINDIEMLETRNRVVLTFGNSNYYGAFCLMLIPFVMELWIHADKWLEKVLFILLDGCLVSCVMMSKSTMAWYLMIFIIIAICIYELKSIFKQWIYFIGFVVTMFIIVLVLNVCSSGKLMELISVSVDNDDAFIEENQDVYEVEDIHIEDRKLIIEGVDKSFIIEYDEKFTFYDENGNILDIENNGNIVTFTQEPYNALSVEVSYNQRVNMIYIEIDAGYKETIDFYIADNGFKGVGADGGAVDDIGGNYKDHKFSSLFTGRGYIWINTVSMLDEVLFIGKGCGNFIHNFKQYDYVGLLKSQGTHNVIIDRPHNMFLQYSIDIGIIGTVALFAIVVYVLLCWITQNFKKRKTDNPLSTASFFAVIVFMAFMLLNDSLVVLSPYMWMCLGMNMSIQSKNCIIQKN